MASSDSYRVLVSQAATDMLASHAAFLARVSPQAAKRLRSSFYEAAKSLESMPLRCPTLKDPCIPENKYRFLVFAKRYMLLFQMDDATGTVFVDYTLDCRQDYGRLLR
jgi:hypothetical protein